LGGKMATVQLNTRVDESAYKTLSDLTAKLGTTKAHLIEKAITLLNDHFEKLERAVGQSQAPSTSVEIEPSPIAPVQEALAPAPTTPQPAPSTHVEPKEVAEIFLSFLSKSMEEYDELYRKLAGDLPKPR
jgi:hypothetical protein